MLIDDNDIRNSVELRDFTKVYGSGKKSVEACSKINFFAKENCVTGLLGPNGAGKSTMLKALCGTHYATSGSVKVFNSEDPSFIRQVTGFVPEFPELDGALTVAETLLFEQELHSVQKELREKLFFDALKTMDLEEVKNKKVSSLSKGFLQRTSFAKVLAFDPKLLVLDEFSGGLDPSQILHLRTTIKKLSKTKTIILSTHHIEEALALCDFIYIVNNGSIAAYGTSQELVQKSGKKNLEEAYISFTSVSKGN